MISLLFWPTSLLKEYKTKQNYFYWHELEGESGRTLANFNLFYSIFSLFNQWICKKKMVVEGSNHWGGTFLSEYTIVSCNGSVCLHLNRMHRWISQPWLSWYKTYNTGFDRNRENNLTLSFQWLGEYRGCIMHSWPWEMMSSLYWYWGKLVL